MQNSALTAPAALQFILGLLVLGSGVRAAMLSRKASTVKARVGVIEAASHDRCESGEDVTRLQDELGLMQERQRNSDDASAEAASLNRSAAAWAAWSAIFGGAIAAISFVAGK